MFVLFFFKQKTAYEMRISDWSSDVCSSDLEEGKKVGESLREVEPDDLVKFGLIPEFVGRLPVLATLDELDEAALMQILTEPKNALTKQYAKLFEMEGVDLEFRSDEIGRAHV